MATRNGKSQPRSAERKIFPTRKLKVRKGAYLYQYETRFDSNRPYRRPRAVPWIHIKGYWLGEAGFDIGSVLDVHVVEHGWIVLRVRPTPS